MKDRELDILIDELESNADMSVAEVDGVVHALAFLLPEAVHKDISAQLIATTDGAMGVADDAYPNWTVHIHGRANDRDGHWRCTLRKSDSRDNDAVIGAGRSPVLAQSILAAVLRLAMTLSSDRTDA